MKKIISFILGTIVALNLSISVANAAAKEVRVAFFLEWPTPNQEDKVKGLYEKALGVPVKWTNFSNGGAMTDAMLAGDIDISYSQGLVPFINAVKSKGFLELFFSLYFVFSISLNTTTSGCIFVFCFTSLLN